MGQRALDPTRPGRATGMMKKIATAYNRFIAGLAGLGGVLLAAVFVGVILDVSLRTAGFKPLQWYSAFTEYSLLFVTMLAAPWLVRSKGHVAVESLTMAMPPGLRRLVAKLAYLMCILLSLMFVWYGMGKMVGTFLTGEIDIRSIDMPRWLLYASFTLGFALIAIEFLRYLLGFDSYYAGRSGSSKDTL